MAELTQTLSVLLDGVYVIAAFCIATVVGLLMTDSQ